MSDNLIAPSLAPWLTVSDGAKAVNFYTRAFGATESYRLEDPGGGLVVRLAIVNAEFWVSSEGVSGHMPPLGGNTIRLILTVADPDALFDQAIAAGAEIIFPVNESHGWRLGRLVDPFGLHWEIGRPL